MIEKISSTISKTKPELIYMPFKSDVHTDHKIISQATQSSIKWFRHNSIKKVLMYETLSETNFSFIENDRFKPNTFIDITDYIDDKVETMKIYKTEILEHPFPRSEKSIRALASLRGSQSGFDSAEAFALVIDRK